MQSINSRCTACLCFTLTLGSVATTTVCAQQIDSIPASMNTGTSIKWWHGLLFAGGVSALSLLDGSVRHASQDNRGATGNEVASVVRRMGQPEIYASISLGLLGAGLASGNSRLTGVGARATSSLALSATAVYAGKYLMGRGRPDQLAGDEPSMPSGHTAMAFALATSLADDINRPWATVGLYTAATAVGWSRVNDNRHWLSDVAAGAVLGIASAKFASGKWTIFGIRAPSILAGPSGVGVGWNAQF